MARYLILFFVALLAFGGALGGGFHLDDYSLFANPSVTSPSGFWHIWTPLQPRPLTYLTFWCNYQIGGQNPLPYHLTNVLLHLAAVCLLFRALQPVLPPNAAFLAAGLFAVHPLQAETVAYVFARATLLSTVFCLLCWLAWMRKRPALAVLWFLLALLSKEESVTFPLFLLFLSFARNQLSKFEIRTGLLLLGLSVLAGIRATLATHFVAGSGAGFGAGVTPFAYLESQGIVILRYLQLLLVPFGFTIEPNFHFATLSIQWTAWIAVIAAITLLFWKRTSINAAFWILCGFLLLLPSSSIFPAADLSADRRMYLPMIAFSAAIGLLASAWKVWLPATAAALLIVCSIFRMAIWRTDATLWREAVQHSPDNVRALVQLGRNVPPEEAATLFRRAKMLEPTNGSIATEIGSAWLRQGQPAQALAEFGRALALAPHDPNAISNRGTALLALGQTASARQDFHRALQIDPCLAAARKNLRSLGENDLPACATAP